MSGLLYRLFYRLGSTPWERLHEMPAARQLHDLIAAEEARRQQPFGTVLDLGCGTGRWSVILAERGWDVTGVELVGRALDTARERARAIGVDVRYVQGDVTKLADLDIGDGYQLILDLGTIHGVPASAQPDIGRRVTEIAASDATLLMYALRPKARGPLPRGLSRDEIAAIYPRWTITDAIPFDPTGLPDGTRADEPTWFRLERRA